MKITKIEIQNYRAFYGNDYVIETDKKNVLIYGENGSGKSSFYRALEDFFRSANNETLEEEISFTYNYFNESDEGKITIYFTGRDESSSIPLDMGVPLDTAGGFAKVFSSLEVPSGIFVQEVGKQNPFFTYKRILRTFLFDKEQENKVEHILFYLLIEEVLESYELSLNATSKLQIGQIWRTLKKETFEPRTKPQDNFKEWQSLFNDNIEQLLESLSLKTNDFLAHYFSANLKINLSLASRFEITNKESAKQQIQDVKINIEVKLFDKQIHKHHDFLNEARLSALAICLYLASLKIIPQPRVLKLLVLDDIFIGLDMSNRLPLLKILKNEFSDYQIFLTTYDRQWFELSKQWFENKTDREWKFYEMYVDDISHENFDVPFITPLKSKIEKAEEYLIKHDYPACASYLRRACEEKLDAILKPEYYKSEVKGTVQEGNLETKDKKLNAKITVFKEFCKREDIVYTNFEDLGIYKDILLNPLSHNDINSPIFKAELISIINVIKELQDIFVKSKEGTNNKQFTLKIEENGVIFSARIRTREVIQTMEYNGISKLMNAGKVELMTTKYNELEEEHKEPFNSLKECHEFICNKYNLSYNQDDILNKMFDRNGQKFKYWIGLYSRIPRTDL